MKPLITAIIFCVTLLAFGADVPKDDPSYHSRSSRNVIPVEIRTWAIAEIKDWFARDLAQLVKETGAEVDRCGNQVPILIGSKQSAFIALVWSGDKAACADAVRILSAPQEAGRDRILYFPIHEECGRTTENTTLLLAALEPHQPETVRKIRAGILAASVRKPRHVRILPRKSVDEMTPDEIKKIAQSDTADPQEREPAMRRWLRSGDADAEKQLLAIMRDEKAGIHFRCNAAAALAACCRTVDARKRELHAAEKEALEWLIRACGDNVGLGGIPALSLLAAGPEGEKAFLNLLAKEDGEKLPYPFPYAIAECPRDTFFRLLDRFLVLKNHKAQCQSLSRIGGTPLPAPVLARLIDYIETRRGDPDALAAEVIRSLTAYPPADTEARNLAGTWVDHMLSRDNPKLWAGLARAIIDSGLGTRECAVAAARRHLTDADLRAASSACRVLGVAGKPDDVPRIWARMHVGIVKDGKLAPHIESVGLLADGWLAVIRLTNPVPVL